MSPKTTGEVIADLYPKIMQDVIDASLVDFEDTGISSTILYELQSLWQQALSDTGIGHFPWDPSSQRVKSEVNAECNTTQTLWIEQKDLYSMSTLTEAQLSQLTPLGQSLARAESHKKNLQRAQEAARHKAEDLARRRAEKFVEQVKRISYADRIKMEGGMGRPAFEGEAAVVAGLAIGGVPAIGGLGWGGEGATAYIEQIRHGVNQQMGIFGNVGAGGPQPSFYGDPVPYGNIEGLHIKPTIKLEPADIGYTVCPNITEYRGHSVPQQKLPQLDGDDDYDELNDGDDEHADSDKDEFEDVQELCVCLYDKVVRNRGKVSHKWKCALRDGVLITEGREYPFGKASAEFIW